MWRFKVKIKKKKLKALAIYWAFLGYVAAFIYTINHLPATEFLYYALIAPWIIAVLWCIWLVVEAAVDNYDVPTRGHGPG